jgi:Ca-activated chloride channel family protein
MPEPMTRHFAALLVVTLFALNIAAQEKNPPAPPKEAAPVARPDATQDQGVKKLSRRDRKERRARLSDKYQKFLIDVEPIIMADEVDAFLILETDAQRDLWIEDFWNRRDPDPRSSVNEYREQYGELLIEARAKYKNTSVDPARILLLRGRPADVTKIDCDKYFQPIEIWRYNYIEGFGRDPLLLFYQPRNGVAWRLWVPRGRDIEALAELLSVQGEVDGGVANVFLESAGSGRGSHVSKVAFECKDGDKLLNAIGWMQNSKHEVTKVFNAPIVDGEEADDLLRSVVLTDPNAPKLSVEVFTAYPGKKGGRTATELRIGVPKSQLTVKDLEGTRYYNLDVNGEILKEGKLFETYRYHFDYPADSAAEKLPVIVERYLRPADYVARIKIKDVNSGAEVVVEEKLTVPEITASAEEVARTREGSATISRLQDEFRSGESRLRIVPLGNELLTGLQHIETMVSGSAITAVEFYLDGKKVMVKRAPPYTLDLDFGLVPQVRRVRAVGLNANGKIISGDEMVLNTGADPFRTRIAHPRVATNLSGPTRVEVEVDTPDGETLEKVELYYNETRLATLYSPPFVQTVNIPSDGSIGYLRAVAHLKEQSAPAEDVVFLNSPEYLEEVEVHLIELPTTVIRGGRTALGLQESDFKVLDEGKPAKISKFEYVTNIPLSVGMAIDSSGSMRPRILEAQKAGAEFLSNILRKGDRSFLIGFNEEASVIQKWTNRLSDLHAGLASVRAEESTALYDAIVLSLYHFHGIKGQKALVVISDGKDTASRFSFDQALEYARRSGVPIYMVGLGIKAADVETRSKIAKFVGETGGASYYIDKASDLKKVYDEIQTELRSQYILGIYPPFGTKPGSKWREVEVQVKDGRAKTIRGYYP